MLLYQVCCDQYIIIANVQMCFDSMAMSDGDWFCVWCKPGSTLVRISVIPITNVLF